jgi:hypothetical protein
MEKFLNVIKRYWIFALVCAILIPAVLIFGYFMRKKELKAPLKGWGTSHLCGTATGTMPVVYSPVFPFGEKVTSKAIKYIENKVGKKLFVPNAHPPRKADYVLYFSNAYKKDFKECEINYVGDNILGWVQVYSKKKISRALRLCRKS